ncbi:MAG: tRNA pseudouridine(38-40) synthase TruA [Betaproteobacteria bacterium]|nr:tRNA pseudouridine(38-40) synthase TruA [Betaproteobacteria bacterium]
MTITLTRIALGLEYDGSDFCGWQTQPSGCAVQDVVDAALSRIAAQRIESQCAGRTDAGVHAMGQVIHFDTGAKRPLTAWVRGVNACLPDSIAVKWAREVVPEFHARYAARGRAYVYLLLNRAERPGLSSRRVGWCHRPLDLPSMREAASYLLGVHDFSSFRAAECQAKSPVKEMRLARIDQVGSLLIFRFAADAFLHHMVRNIVGSLVYTGTGARPPGWMKEVLESRDRAVAAPTFSPSGLYLSAVQYDAAWGFPEPSSCIDALMAGGLSS